MPGAPAPSGHTIVVMVKTTRIPAAEFKARCLELMDRVSETRETYVITKHGTPVARLVSVESDRDDRPFFGSMAGTVVEHEGATDPVPGEWLADPRPVRRRA
jgi:prevent-host-death family protein